MPGFRSSAPWANRLDEQAFYANGKKYAFDMELGNVRGAHPIHGFLSAASQWEIVEAKADAHSAWVTSRLEFFRQPAWMAQFPFAHTIEMTHRLQDGALEVTAALHNLSAEPMPVAIGFHPYFTLSDCAARRVDHRHRRPHGMGPRARQDPDRRDASDRTALSESRRGARCAITISITCSAISFATRRGAR